MDGDVVTLALDEGTFNDLNANPHNAIPEYINTLMTANVIPVMDIKAISFSLDNDNFIPLGINHLTVANDDIQEVAAVKEPNCDQELWGEQATKLLLDKYETYLPLVGPLKRFKKKKNLWIAIAEDLENILNIKKSASQCENRYKTVLKRKKGIVKHNQKTGEVPVIDPYNNELTKIAAIDDSIEPEVKLGVNNCIIKRKISELQEDDLTPSTSSCSSRSSTPTIPKRKKPLGDILYDIARIREEGRNQRHQEKLDLLRELFKKT
ncbi:hypothetical protein FQR65_LT15646 [Abscondita terminalis]|nr:hypothetical protein FQR65_LT15646 [Abscondita terminalis]